MSKKPRILIGYFSSETRKTVAQFKKDNVRDAILEAAAALFQEEGYTQVGLRAITKRAKTSLTNVYSYFDSKLEIMYALYSPWFTERIKKLQADALAIPDVDERLRFILESLWREIPGEGGLAANLIEALSTAQPEDHYNPKLIRWAEKQIAGLLSDCLADHKILSPDHAHEVAYIVLMALDGFSINRRLRNVDTCSDKMIDVVCALLQSHQPGRKTKARSASRRNRRTT